MVPIKGLAIPCVYYIEHFLDDKSSILFEKLRSTIKWEKTAKINRWVALYGELPNQEEEETSTTTTKSSYRYRDQPSQGLQPWTAELLDIKKKIEEYYLEHNGSPVEFNVCLLNMYETGQQAIGWHADREEIGRTTPIASISLGATRQFLLKHKSNKDDCASFKMTNGSLTIMDNICQHEYLHSVPKESSIKTSRINLTFRCKKLGEHTKGEKMHERRENLNFLTKTPTSGKNFCNTSIDVDSNVFGSNVTIGDVPIITDHHSAWMIKGQLGAEQFIGAEIEETFKQYNGFNVIAKPWGVPGYVFVQFNHQNGSSIGSSSTNEDSLKDVSKMLLSLRCAMFVMKYHDWYTLDDVLQYKQKNEKSDTASTTTTDDVLTTTTTTPVLPISLLIGEDLFLHFKDRLEKNNVIIPSLIPSTEDTKKILFRVTCDRLGTHKFNSMNVEREIGGAMYEYYKSSKPSMLKFQKLIRVDVIGTNIIIGEQIHEKDISRRMVYFYRNRVVLKANMAHIMLR
jgi:alkylated DNA repair dioxygenase AlkB